ncbi:phosphorylcholine transferase LicD [Exiguobacterium undae]|uniref:LicD family protein n=1 Tax=Exiguobacterium undae TaxID=169177 RepID=UPI00384C5020
MREPELISIDTNQVKQIQIEALRFLIDYLEKNKINYFIIAGTLLGAVRHKGFIPWDDDVDIGMTRQDYNKFMTLFKNDFERNNEALYFLQNWDTDPHFAMPFSKLRVNNTIYREEVTQHVNIHHGIYIDIFPFDDVHSNKLLSCIQEKGTTLLQKMILAKSSYRLTSRKMSIFYKLALFPFPKKLMVALIYAINAENTENNKLMVCSGGSYGFKKEVVEKQWFERSEILRFENLEVNAPLGYIAYLTNLYGDYKKIPEINQRGNRHKIIEKSAKKL